MLSHLLLSVGIQFVVARLSGSWIAGATTASAWAISREITQAEYRWIEHYGSGLRANMPWWGGLDARVWQSPDPWIDWLAPTLLAFAIAAVANSRLRSNRRRPT